MKKILIIDDQKEDFEKMRELLGRTYEVLPERFEEISACIEYPQVIGKSIVDFAIQQIDDNYKDLRLVLCDIKLGVDFRGGEKVVKSIRNHKIPDSPDWTSFVPIIACTHYADKQLSILDYGATVSLLKDEDALLFSGFVEANITTFEKKLKLMSLNQLETGDKGIEIEAGHKKDGEKSTNQKVFIIHGHDEGKKEILARFIENLGLTAVILHEQYDEGNPIIDKFENNADVDFAIALYTKDDKGKAVGEKKYNYRARQNVVFEHGYMMGKLGRKKVCALVEADVEQPGDLSGVIYIKMDNDGAWKIKLAQRMYKQGIKVDFRRIRM